MSAYRCFSLIQVQRLSEGRLEMALKGGEVASTRKELATW